MTAYVKLCNAMSAEASGDFGDRRLQRQTHKNAHKYINFSNLQKHNLYYNNLDVADFHCWPHGRLQVHCAGLCVPALGGDLKTAWRLSFSDESALEVSVTQDALYKSTSYLTLPLLSYVK